MNFSSAAFSRLLPALLLLTNPMLTHSLTLLHPRQIPGALPEQANERKAACARGSIRGSSLAENHHHIQVSDAIACGRGEHTGCSAAKIEEHTFGIEGSASVNVGNVAEIGGGIVEEWTTGNQYTCEGENTDAVCVWARSLYKQYQVAPTNIEGCEDEYYPKKWFPVEDSGEAVFYCVRGERYCRSKGDEYWEKPL